MCVCERADGSFYDDDLCRALDYLPLARNFYFNIRSYCLVMCVASAERGHAVFHHHSRTLLSTTNRKGKKRIDAPLLVVNIRANAPAE